MKFKGDKVAVIAIILISTIVIAEILTYIPGTNNYDASVEWRDDEVSYSISSSGSEAYDVVLMDPGAVAPVSSLYLFNDENYDHYFNEASSISKFEYIDQDNYISQIQKGLKYRGFTNVTICSSNELLELLQNSIDNPVGIGIYVSSYSLPSSIYSGNADDLLLRWIHAGGTVYWFSSEIGKFYSEEDELFEVSNNQELFFGRECINVNGPSQADSTVDNGFAEAFSLKNGNLQFSMDTDCLSNGVELGYSADGYASTAVTQVGAGQVYIFGGGFDFNQIDDACQLIASGYTVTTTITDHSTGNIVRGTIVDVLMRDSSSTSVYIYLGGTYTVYGEAFYE